MPGEDIQSWSTTAASNGTADSSINWAEGQPRSSVNNSARSMMAAHAKDRNLRNGSIVTSGTADAQIFFSGLNYTTVPTGLRATLKIGPGLTNTGPATLNMDNIGAAAIKNSLGGALSGGELVAGTYREFIFDGTNPILINTTSETAMAAGRLTYVSATALKFAPYNGGKLKISGVLFDVPPTGITGLGNTSVYVNSTAAQNLAADTTYLVSAFNNGGVLTANFVAPAAGHSASTTAGNVGTEIITGADGFSLIGMCRTNASSQFQDDDANRFVLSWFNRRNIHFAGANTAGAVTTSTVATELGAVYRANFLTWGDESISCGLTGSMYNLNAGNYLIAQAAINSLTAVIAVGGHSVIADAFVPVGGAGAVLASEGFHFLTPVSFVGGGTGVFHYSVNGMVRG